MADVRLTQLARLLGLPRSAVDEESALRQTREGVLTLAAALYEEAIASDDVTGIRSALSYLYDRLESLAPYVDAPTAQFVLKYTRDQAEGWSVAD